MSSGPPAASFVTGKVYAVGLAECPYPQLKITRKPESIFGYTLDDVEVVGYRHHPTIKAPIAIQAADTARKAQDPRQGSRTEELLR